MSIDLASIAESIRTETHVLLRHQKHMAETAYKIGGHLIEARKVLTADETFEKWVKANCPFSYQTACRYIRLVANWGTYTEHQRATESITNLLDMVKGKSRKKKGKKTKESASPVTAEAAQPTVEIVAPAPEVVSTTRTPKKSGSEYTSEYVHRMAAECGITGDVVEFLKRFGVRVETVLEVAA